MISHDSPIPDPTAEDLAKEDREWQEMLADQRKRKREEIAVKLLCAYVRSGRPMPHMGMIVCDVDNLLEELDL